MRITHKLLLSAVITLVASFASPAVGSALTFQNEATAMTCTAVVTPVSHGTGSGGCKIRLIQSAKIEMGTALGMTLCDNTFEGRINGNGEGFLYSIVLTACAPINVTPCLSTEVGTPIMNWPVEALAETVLEGVFCFRAFGLTVNCHLSGLLIGHNARHDATITTGAGHIFCEGSGSNSIQGTWISQTDVSHPAFELVH